MPQKDPQYPDFVLAALEEIEELKLQGHHDQSIEAALKLLCRDPDCVAALEELADNYVSLDDFKKAEKACQRALNLDRDSYTAYYILGFIESHHQNWGGAVSHLKLSNRLHPNNAEILRCLGWSLFNNGRRTQGIVILERALNLAQDNSLTLCDLGICYLQVKNFDKSIELLKRAMEIDPNNKRIQECYRAAKGFSERYLSLRTSSSKVKRRAL